jgi:hypothetical protein
MDHAVLDRLLADPMSRLWALPRDMMHAYMHRYIGDDRRGITHGRLAGSADAYSDNIAELYKMPQRGMLYAVDGVEVVHVPYTRGAMAHLLHPATRRLAPAVIVDEPSPYYPRCYLPHTVQRRPSDGMLQGCWSASMTNAMRKEAGLLDASAQDAWVCARIRDDYSVKVTIATPTGSSVTPFRKTTIVLPFSADPHGRLEYVHAAYSAHNACCVLVGVRSSRTAYQYIAWFDPAGKKRAERVDTSTMLSPFSYTPNVQGIIVDADERMLICSINWLCCLTRDLADLWLINTHILIGTCVDGVVLMADGSLVLAATTPADSRPRQHSLHRLVRVVK